MPSLKTLQIAFELSFKKPLGAYALLFSADEPAFFSEITIEGTQAFEEAEVAHA